MELGVSRYAKVRVNAQSRLSKVVDSFGGIVSRSITDFFYDKLVDGVPHHEFKVRKTLYFTKK